MPAAALRHRGPALPVLTTDMDLRIYCPCGNELVRRKEGVLKVRTKLLIRDTDGTVRGICRGCGAEAPLPLEVEIVRPREPRLYVGP